jgi:rhodanese-related sulfurtransferase
VRTKEEFEKGNIKGAINIPVDNLRDRINELDKNKNIYIYCQAGLRGYLAQRMLVQSGYDHVLNLSGGYQLWKACANETELALKAEAGFYA